MADFTQATAKRLAAFVQRTPLTAKLLGKPPFRYLHDLTQELIAQSGFGRRLFSELEMQSEHVASKEAKLAYLQKLIDLVARVTGTPVALSPKKVLAGLEPEQTNAFLQLVASLAAQNIDTDPMVDDILGGIAPPPAAATTTTAAAADKKPDRSASRPPKAEAAAVASPTSAGRESRRRAGASGSRGASAEAPASPTKAAKSAKSSSNTADTASPGASGGASAASASRSHSALALEKPRRAASKDAAASPTAASSTAAAPAPTRSRAESNAATTRTSSKTGSGSSASTRSAAAAAETALAAPAETSSRDRERPTARSRSRPAPSDDADAARATAPASRRSAAAAGTATDADADDVDADDAPAARPPRPASAVRRDRAPLSQDSSTDDLRPAADTDADADADGDNVFGAHAAATALADAADAAQDVETGERRTPSGRVRPASARHGGRGVSARVQRQPSEEQETFASHHQDDEADGGRHDGLDGPSEAGDGGRWPDAVPSTRHIRPTTARHGPPRAPQPKSDALARDDGALAVGMAGAMGATAPRVFKPARRGAADADEDEDDLALAAAGAAPGTLPAGAAAGTGLAGSPFDAPLVVSARDAVDGASGGTGAAHGHLVQSLLAASQDAETALGAAAALPTAALAAENEAQLAQIPDLVQSACRTVIPFGPWLNTFQEDLEALDAELAMWQAEHAQQEPSLAARQQKLEQAVLAPLRQQIAACDADAARLENVIQVTRLQILENEDLLEATIRQSCRAAPA
ncbi:hypothetical protein CXG81DRAFT_26503 [Caulochytrium protostelioides]|uniref:TRAF3-interacting protein 1 n=1 Tax=Caulochytrium protostelioides TaxID=1555241 RepID=A0A4P9X6L3_9FUNG|nr:hypothetical protein CXG81DRAFT_26503 [Caulochytrium protostelioides]|eukprot:RKP00802.1 hypothetical protein CXG81DRAFT_26503 [Caulochytrium protostelioides]